MAGFPAFGDGFKLADGVTEVFSTAGALVKPLALAHTWAAAQSPGAPTALSIVAGHVAWSADTSKQHMSLQLGAATVIDAPSGTLATGTPYMLALIGAGASPTWASIYDWGGAAPDFSTVTAGKIAWVAMIVWSATRIHCAANLGIDGVGFAGTP